MNVTNMLYYRLIFWGILLILLLIPGGFLVSIIGRLAGFRPGAKVGSTETFFGWLGIVVLGSIMLGMCMCGGLIDWAVQSAVDSSAPRSFEPKARPIPNDWDEKGMEQAFLSDMQEFNARVGWGAFGKKGKLGFQVGGGDNIRVDNKSYSNSISMHPPRRGHSTVSYRLGRQMKLFKGWAAYCDRDHPNWTPQSLATYVVFGDGVCLWASNPLQVGAMERCRVNVEGVDVLELQVHCPGDNSHVWSVWLDAQVLK